MAENQWLSLGLHLTLIVSEVYNLPHWNNCFFMGPPPVCFMHIPATHRSNVPWMLFASNPSLPHDTTNAAHHVAAPSLATLRSTPNLLSNDEGKTKAKDVEVWNRTNTRFSLHGGCPCFHQFSFQNQKNHTKNALTAKFLTFSLFRDAKVA